MRNITFANVISNRMYDENTGWRDMQPEERNEALATIKSFLLSTCRTGSEAYKAIQRLSTSNLPKSIGIYDRLATDGYTAGQDYPSELAFIKQQIKRQC